MEKILLTKVYRSDKDKDGNPLKTRDGRTYTRLGVQAKEYGEKWLSGFDSFWNKDWKEGMVVGVEVEETMSGSKTYLNITKPDPLKELEERVKRLEGIVYSQNQPDDEGDGGHVEDPGIKDAELPF